MKQELLYGKLPPQAPELEDAILGAIMMDPAVFENVLQIIKSSDSFYKSKSVVIYDAMKRIHSKGGKIDFLTVCNELGQSKELEAAGGSFYVTSLTRDVVGSSHVIHHAKIVRQTSTLRDLINICGETITKAYDSDDSLCFDLIDETVANIVSLTSDLDRSRIETIGEAMQTALNESIENKEKGVELIGSSTGFKSLDNKIGGLIDSDYVIIAAGTAEGKSTLALNMAADLAFEQNVPTLFFSLEMQNKQLAYKTLSNKVGVSVKKLRMGQIDDAQIKKAFEVKSKDGGAPLYLNDKGGLNITEICAIIRQMVRTKNIKKVFVDYLQLVGADAPGRKTGMREQDVSYVSKQLRGIALDLDITVIALSQLTEMEKGAVRPYKLGDLRESKAIGHDATTVLFIWKPILPNQNRLIENVMYGDESFVATKHDALIICAKNRLDDTGAIRFVDEFWASRFVEYKNTEYTSEAEPAVHKISRDYSEPIKLQPPNDLPF
jgi:replicative DNA helicase